MNEWINENNYSIIFERVIYINKCIVIVIYVVLFSFPIIGYSFYFRANYLLKEFCNFMIFNFVIIVVTPFKCH